MADYPFTVSGLSMGVTAGASVSRLEGMVSGITEVSDFAGTYNAVGAGGALVGGVGGVRLRNEKGVVLDLKGPKAGVEFAANRQRDQDCAEVKTGWGLTKCPHAWLLLSSPIKPHQRVAAPADFPRRKLSST